MNKIRLNNFLKIIGWHIQALQNDAAALELVAADWEVRIALKLKLKSNYTREKTIEKAKWLQSTLVKILNTYVKPF